MKRIISLIFLILLVAGTIFILSRSKYQTSQGEIFGTTYHVRYNSTQNLDKEIAGIALDDELARYLAAHLRKQGVDVKVQ